MSKGDQIKIVMPNLAGLTPQEAESRLRGLGWTGNLNVQDGGETDAPTQFGIIEQEFGEGQQIDRTSPSA